MQSVYLTAVFQAQVMKEFIRQQGTCCTYRAFCTPNKIPRIKHWLSRSLVIDSQSFLGKQGTCGTYRASEKLNS